MKLYKHVPTTVVRVDIFERKIGCKTITVVEEDPFFVSEELQKILKNKTISITLNPLNSIHKVTVQCYRQEGLKKEKGKYKSFTVNGLSIEEIKELFIKNLD
jgi:hypothetical protein